MGDQVHTEVVTDVVFLGSLMERIAKGRVRVPEFQRPFVWRQQDVHDLLDSVFQGFPIGSILVWETDKNIVSASNFGPIPIPQPLYGSGRIDYVLDGQQRLSALFGTLHLPDEPHVINTQIDWRVYFDLEALEFLREPRGGATAQYFPVASLLNTVGFINAAVSITKRIKDERQQLRWLNAAERLAKAFRDYKLPLIRIRETDLNGAVTVFARLNRRGRRISHDQMVSALTYQEGKFHLAEKLDHFQDELSRKGFGNLNRVFLLRSVLAALDQDIYAKDWGKLVVREDVLTQLPDGFESATKGVNRALEFLKNLGVTSDRLLPYGLQLVLLGEFFRLCQSPCPEVKHLLQRWFWVTSFTGWFGAVSTTRVTRALLEIRQLARGEESVFSEVDLNETALPFPDRFDGKSARVRALLLYLTSLKPRSLAIHNRKELPKLNTGRLFSSLGPKALGYLLYNPKETEYSSIPANRMFADENISGNIFEHLTGLPDGILWRLLPSHGFVDESVPESIRALRSSDPRMFIKIRKESLIHGERQFMDDQKVKLPEILTGDTIADSDTSDFAE